ncbi:MGMT family protein [Crocinitomix catalasitica]|uniref:MGMT family protein n=1 Tax=Crocinitomix catalasitica TaxID=184607 RepID=UPI0004817E97|nr:MGMT family protein [Crocinitomix catalasitica]
MDQHKDFFEKVFQVVELIPHGRVTSYGAIAACLGAKKSSRVVGWAMNASHSREKPIPAHRVVNRNGLLTGKMHFKTPTDMEERLKTEGHKIENDKIAGFKDVFWDPSVELGL